MMSKNRFMSTDQTSEAIDRLRTGAFAGRSATAGSRQNALTRLQTGSRVALSPDIPGLPIILLIALVVLLFLTNSRMLESPRALGSVLGQVAVTGSLAIAMTFALSAGGIDLSVGAVAGLAAVAAAGQQEQVFVTLFIAIFVGLIAGAVQGSMIAGWKTPPYLVTLAGLYLFRSLAVMISDGGRFFSLGESGLADLSRMMIGDLIPAVFLLFLGLAVVAHLILSRWQSAGSGSQIGFYIASGLCAGVGGLLLLIRLRGVSPSLGIGMELPAIAAVLIGGGWLGRASVIHAVIGAMIIALLDLNLVMSLDVQWRGAIAPAVIIAVIAVRHQFGQE